MTQTYSRPDGKNRFQIASASERPLFSSWLDQEFNSIYGVLNGLTISDEISASEWTNVTGTFTRESTTSFSVTGNLASVFEALRAIQFTDPNNVTTTSHILSSSYNDGTGITTVTVYDAVVPSTISKVNVGLISEESATIPSVDVKTKTANYTVGAKDQILLVDDSQSYTGTMMFDDNAEVVAGNTNGYYATLITLPQPSVLPNKLLCVKKIAGSYKTIVLSHYLHAEVQSGDDTIHQYTYDFQILGDSSSKNRITLSSIGDCVWIVSNGTNWYELTPEASETVKGIVRFATSDEMTLTAQQIEDGEELSKTLAVSPYNADANYMRTDASNMRFASNYIYKTSQYGAATLENDYSVLVQNGLGINIPTGRDNDGVSTSKRYELSSNAQLPGTEDVSEEKHSIFVKSDGTLLITLSKNYHTGYQKPVIEGTTTGTKIMWFDFTENLLKWSDDNGTNWVHFDGAGPIAEYWGDGTKVTNLVPFAPVGFVNREEYDRISNNFIIKQSRTGTADWYRIWADGTIEQGGRIQPSNQFNTNNFLIPFRTTAINVIATCYQDSGGNPDKIAVGNFTTTTFSSTTGFGAEGTAAKTFSWYAIGK